MKEETKLGIYKMIIAPLGGLGMFWWHASNIDKLGLFGVNLAVLVSSLASIAIFIILTELEEWKAPKAWR